jgi:hypothetical protein
MNKTKLTESDVIAAHGRWLAASNGGTQSNKIEKAAWAQLEQIDAAYRAQKETNQLES